MRNNFKTPFSKKNIIYARMEAYLFTGLLLLFAFLDKDISTIGTVLLTLSWGGYKLLQSLYIKMAEREHLEEIRQGRLRDYIYDNNEADTSNIDSKIEELEMTTIVETVQNELESL